MDDRYEIVMCGIEDHGILAASEILGEALVLYENRYAVLTKSSDTDSFQGYLRTELIASKNPPFYPRAMDPDMVVVFSQENYHFFSNLKPSSLLLYDEEKVVTSNESGAWERGFPFSQIASSFPKRGAISSLALGLIIGISGVVSIRSLERVIESKRPDLREVTLEALREGLRLSNP